MSFSMTVLAVIVGCILAVPVFVIGCVAIRFISLIISDIMSFNLGTALPKNPQWPDGLSNYDGHHEIKCQLCGHYPEKCLCDD